MPSRGTREDKKVILSCENCDAIEIWHQKITHWSDVKNCTKVLLPAVHGELLRCLELHWLLCKQLFWHYNIIYHLPLLFWHHETPNRTVRWHLYGVLVEDLPLPRAKYSKMRQRLLLHLPMGQISGGPIGLQQIDSKLNIIQIDWYQFDPIIN